MALEDAWTFLKAPIDATSLTQEEDSRYEGLGYGFMPEVTTNQNNYKANFIHPHTEEVFPMTGRAHLEDGKPSKITVMIHDKDGKEHGSANFHPWWDAEGTEYPADDGDWTGGPSVQGREKHDDDDPYGYEEPWAKDGYEGLPLEEPDLMFEYAMRDILGREEHGSPPVGMGSAMYDFASTIADKHGIRVVPSAMRSRQAENMWRKHEDKEHWPPLRNDKGRNLLA